MDPARTLRVDCLKLENFDGSNFNAWRRKVIIGMQLLKIYYVVSEEKPDSEEDSESEASWVRDDHFCRSYLLNCLADHLADAYTNKLSTKEIWNALEDQYNDEEKLSKSHLIDKFLDLKFQDDTERFIRIEDKTRTHTKTELLSKQKASANMLAANSEKGNNSSFNKKKKFFNKKKNHNPKNLNVQKKEFKKSERDLFSSYVAAKENVSVADCSVVSVLETGIVVLTLSLGKTLTLKDVKHVPSIAKNLVSRSLLYDAYRIDSMYKISTIAPNLVINKVFPSAYSTALWGNKHEKCEVCAQAKLTKKSFSSVVRSTNLLDLIHSDTCDFKSFVTRGGKKYFIIFIDDHSCFCHVYLLKSKDKTFSKFVEFRTRVEKQLGLQVKKLRSDRGGEYHSKESEAYFEEHGIIAKTIVPYSSFLDLGTNFIIEARDAEFFEDKFIKDKCSLLKDIAENTSMSDTQEEPVSRETESVNDDGVIEL
ncbi:uncharacterized protein LOC109839181 [Asparagus officinalis]|uniref:uncharacterized protein LOC109839181 n=1 Tax=Asparagus officinalis TaxID=4686 RepID=UPI00098E4145|nr:uncharacterized protein LOC109839181 [Asparagus officinalis]